MRVDGLFSFETAGALRGGDVFALDEARRAGGSRVATADRPALHVCGRPAASRLQLTRAQWLPGVLAPDPDLAPSGPCLV